MIRTSLAYVRKDVRMRHQRVAQYAYGDILDIGYARKPNHFLKGKSVTGIDLERPEMHKERAENYDRMIQGDVRDMLDHFRPQSFDTVIALEFIEHIDWYTKFLEHCHTVLKKGGRLILSTPTPYYYISVIGNSFLISGRSKGCFEHIALHEPRVLNMVADQKGFETVKVTSATRNYIPFFSYSLLYIYRKK